MTIQQTLRTKADALQKQVDHCFRDRLTNTRKRAGQDASMRKEGRALESTQAVMRKLADMHEHDYANAAAPSTNIVPYAIRELRTAKEIGLAVRHVLYAEHYAETYHRPYPDAFTTAQEAIRALMTPADPRVESLHALERDCVRLNIPGFFPTPRAVVEQMLDLADIRTDGHLTRVLEPSAGRGDILDVIRDRHPKVSITAVEYNLSLRKILGLKGYELQAEGDFMQWRPTEDALFGYIIMNPPFENARDIDHVQRAYTFLKPGGRIVAIMGAGTWFRSNAKTRAFLEAHGECYTIPLASGTFETAAAASRIIVIDKPSTKPDWIDETTWKRASAITPPPIAGEADTEYESRLDAERVSLEWRAAIRASGKQYGTDDLPLFGGTRQGRLF